MEDQTMKKTIAILTCTVMMIAMSASHAAAGAARRHTLEGFALGTGFALLGAAIYHEMHKDAVIQYQPRKKTPPRQAYRQDRHRKRYADRGRRANEYRGRGHWVVQEQWIPPVYEKRWNPGHYNRRGQWISGHYKKFLVQEGYYKKVKIWVQGPLH